MSTVLGEESTEMTDQGIPKIRMLRPETQDILDAVSAEQKYNEYDDQTIIQNLIANDGIVARCAASLGMREDQIIQIITRNAHTISQQMRAVMMVSGFTTVVKAGHALQSAMSQGEMSAGDLGRTFAASLSAFSQLAGQFHEAKEETETDDADAAKSFILDRLGNIGKREQLDRAQEQAAN